jgi:hypothetical protein
VIDAAQHPVVALSWWEIWPHSPPPFSFPRNPGNNLFWSFLNERTEPVYLQFLGQFQLWRPIWLMVSANIFMAI